MLKDFYRVALAVPVVKVAHPRGNGEEILSLIREVCPEQKITLMAFPALAVTSGSCADLFHDRTLVEEAQDVCRFLCEETASLDTLFTVGCPVLCGGLLYSCAVFFCRGRILGIVPQTFLAESRQYYEKRTFSAWNRKHSPVISFAGQESVPFGNDLIFDAGGDLKIAVEMGEELFSAFPQGRNLAAKGSTVLLNLSCAGTEVLASSRCRERILTRSRESIALYARVSAGVYESTTDSVCSGHCIAAANGKLLLDSEKFCRSGKVWSVDFDCGSLASERIGDPFFREDVTASLESSASCRMIPVPGSLVVPALEDLSLKLEKNPFIPAEETLRKAYFEELLQIQSNGLARRMEHTSAKRLVIGISGGLDSTLALLVCCRTLALLGRENRDILAVTMPGFGTTDRTYNNACELCRALGTELRQIPIGEACREHFRTIGHDENVHDVTYENSQARERTQILMDLANSCGGLVVGTGDLSEIAMGWCTYNGDHISNYAVNASIPKTLMRSLVLYEASLWTPAVKELLEDVVHTPVSPELLPPSGEGKILQKTEDLIGPYEVHDFYLYHFMVEKASPEKLLFLARCAFGDAYSVADLKRYLEIFLRRFFTQQFKRNCSTDGPRTGKCGLSPRGDFRMASDCSWDLWKDLLKELS